MEATPANFLQKYLEHSTQIVPDTFVHICSVHSPTNADLAAFARKPLPAELLDFVFSRFCDALDVNYVDPGSQMDIMQTYLCWQRVKDPSWVLTLLRHGYRTE